MLREIGDQPAALERTLRHEEAKVRRVGERLRRDLQLVILIARGSSDNAALFGRYLIETQTGIPVSLAAPSVHTLYKRRLRLTKTLAVGISQSGEGTDINSVLHSCKQSGAYTLAITNAPASPMAAIADESLITHAGPERSVAATKTYTCQLLLLHMLSQALNGGSMQPLQALPDYARSAVEMAPAIDSIVERYRFVDHCVVVGRGLNYASAFELAIKLMETCYVVAERFSAADFLHGPIAVIQRDFPVFLFAPPGETFRDMKSLAVQLKELQADSLVISSEDNILRHASCALKMPVRIPDLFSPIPYIIPGQLFAAKLARLKGLSPDRPRQLNKITRTF
jgi:glucosamine--fructose-6-phosphate aminotransferase (isomerizing)